jgi:ABC-type sugar transport system ATPase subunit
LRTKGTTFVLTYNKVSPFFHVFDRIAIVRGGGISGILHRGNYDPRLLANLVIGREYAETYSLDKEIEAAPGGKLLEIRDFIPGNGTHRISLILHKGEILGIYDPLQEKSSAVINLLNGATVLEKGCVRIEDYIQNITEEHHTIRAGIGIVSEKFFDRLFFRDLSAGQNLVVSAARKSSQFWGHIPSAAEKYLESVYPREIGIPEEYINIPVKLIEKDFQFILALHMRILSGAKIFILENPVRGADLLTRKMVYRKIDSLRKKGTGVIFISTDITELEGFCDRIIQFDKVGSI